MPTIFLSYRRQDSADVSDRLSDYLRRQYGNERVFRDVSTILVGSEFPRAIRLALEDCRAVVVVIGPGWFDARDERGARRLDDPADWVRIEVATALREGKLVIPVLVRGASLPAAHELPEDLRLLAECRPVVLRSGPAFPQDVEGLFRALGRTARGGPPHVGLLVCGAATLLALLGFMIAIAVPPLAKTEAFTILGNERLVEVAIGLEVLRVVGTRRWGWLAVPIATTALQIASFSAGLFALLIILFTLCVLPLVMGTLGPPSSARPLGPVTHQPWRLLGTVVVALSALAIGGGTALLLADTLDLWQFVAGASALVFDALNILTYGPLVLAWILMLLFTLLARRWGFFLAWLLAVGAYVPIVALMVRANVFPVLLTTFPVVLLGMGLWRARQAPAQQRAAIPAPLHARVASRR